MSLEPPAASVLRADNLCKTYRSGHRDIEVLRGVSLSLGSGRTISIRGESGSGKSTLLNLLAGIESADDGEVFWNEVAVSKLASAKRPGLRAAYLGFVFQAYYLVPELNALENVALAARIRGFAARECTERARNLLSELGLGERLKSRPDQLSGGERQRAAIARALINEPSVLLADEPTGNLDERTSGRVMEQLLEAVRNHGTALVLVTHHPGYAAQAETTYQLVEGRLEQ